MSLITIMLLAGAAVLVGLCVWFATMRRRGACGEACAGAWASGLLAVGSLFMACLMQWQVEHPRTPSDWRMDAIDRCIINADEGCRPEVLAEKLSGWR